MICSDLIRQKYLSSLDNDDVHGQILTAWPEIKAGVRRILESFPATADCTTCIALFKLGFDDEHTTNPKTVYVSLSHDSSETGWPPILAKIQSFIDGYGLHLHAHMEHNFPSPLADFPLLLSTTRVTDAQVAEKKAHFNMVLPTRLPTKVNAGADIGACTYVPTDRSPPDHLSNPAVGTLGCWLEIKVHGRGWETVGLTNYHIVRPCLPGYNVTHSGQRGKASGPVKRGTALWKADLRGWEPGTRESVCRWRVRPGRN